MSEIDARPPRAIVAYPGVMPAATEVVRAFAERDLLECYETTVAYRPDGAIDRAVAAIARTVLRERADRELNRRSIASLAGAPVRRRFAWELLRVAAQRLGAGELVADHIWEHMIVSFDADVARRLRSGIGVVYGFEHGCRATFARARELAITTVFDMAAPHASLAQRVLERELERHPELRTAQRDALQARAQARLAHKQAEIDLADLVIANSAFTARSLTNTGFPPDRVRVVPLGAPPVDPTWRSLPTAASARLLFAGTLSVHKGVHVLLEAWRRVTGAGAELAMAGNWYLPDALRSRLPPGVQLLGSMPRSTLFAEYRRASALVFPSLCDGFGMVVTEALAHGLPVITTDCAGAADLIEQGRSGWVLPAGDVDALAERLQWCIDHPGELHAMRQTAEAAAARRPWSRYRADLIAAISAFAPSGAR